MKAIQWVERFQTASGEQLAEEFRSFIGEIGEVAASRGNSLNAVEGAVREQQSKWQAVIRQYPALQGFTFEQLLQEYGHDFAAAQQKYTSRLKAGPKKKSKRGGRSARRVA